MLKDKYPYFLANKAVFANTDLEVTDKYTGEVATRVALAESVGGDRVVTRVSGIAPPHLPDRLGQAVD